MGEKPAMQESDNASVALSEKVERLIVKYHELEIENEALKDEVERLKTTNNEKEEQILKLEKELKNKSLETDELLGKIEAVLGI
jgi:cell division protein FtsB